MLSLFILTLAPVAGAAPLPVAPANSTPEVFDAYWYPNGAEVSRYELRQARYGEYHDGDAVMVFVTEALNPETQIKADQPGPRDIPVLKLNAVRKFYTGIYPYSIMTSVFTPVGAGRPTRLPLKITTSVQEWCGQVFIQLNLEDRGYRYLARSYFESDGDREDRFGRVMTEDALWNMIRIAPADLPRGAFEILPGTLYSRLRHRHPQLQKVQARLRRSPQRGPEGQELLEYDVDMPQAGRRLVIWFEQSFPHRIEAWEEHEEMASGKRLTTRARRTHRMMLDYWNHHADRDRELLPRLGLKAN
jgi:hypothetical protein